MSSFTDHNVKVINQQVKKKNVKKTFNKEMVETLGNMAEYVMRQAYSEIPVDTWNLMEGTGIGVYADGILASFRYDEMATQPRDGYWGKNLLTKALAEGSNRFSSGIWIVAFSTMPYAEEVDESGGFFSEVIVEELKHMVLTDFTMKKL